MLAPEQPVAFMAEIDSATTYFHENAQLQRRTKSFNDVFRIFALRDTAIPQISLSFGGLAAQQMTTKCATVLRFSRRRDLKATFHPFVSFLLWHIFFTWRGHRPQLFELPVRNECSNSERRSQDINIKTEVNKCILFWQHRAEEYSRPLSVKSSSVAGNQQKGKG
jgi:hypothetical protein